MGVRELRGVPPAEVVRRVVRSAQFRLAERRWKRWREKFCAASPEKYRREFLPEQLPNVRVFSFCGARDIALQVISILSFLRHVGIPRRWTVVSDGTITESDAQRLRSLHQIVSVDAWENYLTDATRPLIEPYAQEHPLGKKLAILSSLPLDTASLFVDSDVIFFSGGNHLRELLATSHENHFLKDVGNAVDRQLATPEEKALTPLNSGFLIQNQPLEWMEPLARLAAGAWRNQERGDDGLPVEHYLEQTVAHIAYHASGARMLDENKFVISFADAFDPRDRFSQAPVALRHYVWHTRLKFWSHVPEYLA